jgi:[acyl-carrier-protein] S-malonyltransferase
MIDAGAGALIELGPGKVLSGFMKRIDRRFPVCNVETPAGLEKAAALADA